jgi:hypothetical protein
MFSALPPILPLKRATGSEDSRLFDAQWLRSDLDQARWEKRS